MRKAGIDRAKPGWWRTDAAMDTPLRLLISELDTVGNCPLPYARLPRRLSLYAEQFPRWHDIAAESPRTLLSRPKLGVAAVEALIQAGEEAVRADRTSQGSADIGAEAAVEALIQRLDDRDRALLSARRWTTPPLPHRAVAQRCGVTLAAVQRNGPRAERRFAELLADPVHRAVREYAGQLAQRLGPFVLSDLVEVQLRGLRIEPLSQAAQILLYAAGPYIDCGEWTENTGAGGRGQIRRALDDVFSRQPAPCSEELHDCLTALGMPAEAAWVYLRTQLQLRRFGDICVLWNDGSTANMIEAVLHAFGAPSTPEQIRAGTDVGSLTTINAALAKDRRFVRASRRTWALRQWGVEEYSGVADAIRACLDRHGGQAASKDVVAELLTRYADVAESSVRSYLSTLAFVNENGMIRRRTESDQFPALPPLHQVRGAFPIASGGVRYVVAVTADVTRGSALALPFAVADAIGVKPGRRRTFANDVGEVTVWWKLSMPGGAIVTSLRTHAASVGAVPGDILVLAFSSGRPRVELTCVPANRPGARLVEALVGRKASRAARADLAASLGCTNEDELATVLRERGDDGLADRIWPPGRPALSAKVR